MIWRRAAMSALVVGSIAFGGLAVGGTAPGPAVGDAGADRSAPMTQAEVRRAAELARRATVQVSALACGARIIGSGFGVGGTVVTNRHVVGDASKVVVTGGTVAPAAVLATYQSVDLALVDGVGGPDLERASHRPVRGEPVLVAGRPGAGPVVVRLSQVHLYSDGRPWGMVGEVLLLDTPTGPGWSGGPVLDRQGRVVAVLAAQDQVTGLALAVPLTGEDELTPGPAPADDCPGPGTPPVRG